MSSGTTEVASFTTASEYDKLNSIRINVNLYQVHLWYRIRAFRHASEYLKSVKYDYATTNECLVATNVFVDIVTTISWLMCSAPTHVCANALPIID